MDERSFVAREIKDLIERVQFEPFAIELANGTAFNVSDPRLITLMSEGVFILDTDGTRCVFPYTQISAVMTIFAID